MSILHSELDEEDLIPLANLRSATSTDESVDELAHFWNQWNARFGEIPSCTCMDYVNVYQEIEITEYPTEEEILQSVRPNVVINSDSDDDEQEVDITEISKPTTKEVENALSVVRQAIETEESVPDNICNSSKLKNSLVSNTI